jgi:hypothetical protein
MATKNHNDNHLFVAFLVTFLAGMAFMAIIFMAKGHGMSGKAYSARPGEWGYQGPHTDPCYDASKSYTDLQQMGCLPGTRPSGGFQMYME